MFEVYILNGQKGSHPLNLNLRYSCWKVAPTSTFTNIEVFPKRIKSTWCDVRGCACEQRKGELRGRRRLLREGRGDRRASLSSSVVRVRPGAGMMRAPQSNARGCVNLAQNRAQLAEGTLGGPCVSQIGETAAAAGEGEGHCGKWKEEEMDRASELGCRCCCGTLQYRGRRESRNAGRAESRNLAPNPLVRCSPSVSPSFTFPPSDRSAADDRPRPRRGPWYSDDVFQSAIAFAKRSPAHPAYRQLFSLESETELRRCASYREIRTGFTRVGGRRRSWGCS